MRLTWLSNAPWTPTGYGVQTALITPRLNSKGHEMAVISTYGHQGTAINWNGVTVFGASHHPYAMDIMHGHSDTWRADALITFLDLQVMDVNSLLGTPWIAWMPIDHQTIPPAIWNNAQYADAIITMSKHASAEMDKTGKAYHYIPCAIDTNVYKPLPQAEAREKIKLPLDKFIVGMVAMNKGNPSRKAFQQNIAAFAALKKKHNDVVLYLHTGDGLRGFDPDDLISYCDVMGLSYSYAVSDKPNDTDVIFANQYGLDSAGYSPEMMAQLYSSFDVLTAVTLGEGFGVPILEAQACGCPVIVGDWTSMPELKFSGWKVEKNEAEPLFTPLKSFHYLPRPAAIAERMEAAYQMRGNPDYRHRAVAGAQLYDIDKVIDKYWIPTLEKIGNQLQGKKSGRLARNLDGLR
jgi:glycosyltransferase involved in cell wall biosynthesis